MNDVDPRSKFRIVARYDRSAEIDDDFADAKTHNREKVELNEKAREMAERFSNRSLSPALLTGSVRLTDFSVFFLMGLGIYFWHVVPVDGFTWQYMLLTFGIGLLAVTTNHVADAYQVQSFRAFASQCGRVLSGWIFVFAFLATLAFLTKTGGEFSRIWFGTWFALGLIYILTGRLILNLVVRKLTRDGRLQRRAVIVGGGKAAEELLIALESQPDNDIQICGIFDDRDDDRSPPMVAGYPKLGTVKQLVEFGRVTPLDMLIVTLPMSAESRVLQMLSKLWVLPVDIRLSAHANKLRFRPRSYTFVGSVPFLDIFDKPLADWDNIAKRMFDLFFATLAIIVLSPLMLATALAIRLESPGPVLFRQKRFGFNNEIVSVLKFRSMRHDMADPDAKTVVTKGDTRVTKVGRFIRKASIDELPQLFNVLRGDLSLVGPRPHAVNAQTQNHLWDQVIDGYFARHKVKPGVTGWAQINGWRGEIDTPEKIKRRVDCDLYYIENWSVLFDLYILTLTPFRLINTENAY